jgi:hypothetical protein
VACGKNIQPAAMKTRKREAREQMRPDEKEKEKEGSHTLLLLGFSHFIPLLAAPILATANTFLIRQTTTISHMQ